MSLLRLKIQASVIENNFPARSGEPAHIPALDGLRGVALLLVMLDHWSVICAGPWSALPKAERLLFGVADAGWCGVELFFVLSGFLITGILLDTRMKPGFFGNFYARRSWRIFPPYYVFLFVWLVVLQAAFIDQPPHLALVSEQAWYWSYLQNWRISFYGWPGASVDHLWSLAVEEQFYLVWPVVVWIAGTRGTLWVSRGLIVFSPLLRAAIVLQWPNAHILVYASTITRLDTLACGGALAAILRIPALAPRVHRFAPGLIAMGGAALLMLVAIDHRWTKVDSGTQIFGFSLLGIFFVGTVALLVTTTNSVTRFFSFPALRQIGKLSYTGYLLHLPVFIATAQIVGIDSLPRKLACLALAAIVTFCGAFASWRLLEQPLVRLKNRFAPSIATHQAPQLNCAAAQLDTP